MVTAVWREIACANCSKPHSGLRINCAKIRTAISAGNCTTGSRRPGAGGMQSRGREQSIREQIRASAGSVVPAGTVEPEPNGTGSEASHPVARHSGPPHCAWSTPPGCWSGCRHRKSRYRCNTRDRRCRNAESSPACTAPRGSSQATMLI